MKIFFYPLFKSRSGFFFAALFAFSFVNCIAQDCQSNMIILLKNSKGGIYAGQKITLTNKADGKVFTLTSDAKGEANFKLPCGANFDLSVSNYAKKKEVQAPSDNGAGGMRTLTYEPDMIDKAFAMAMSPAEQAAVDLVIKSLPDTTFIKGGEMPAPALKENFMSLTVNIKDIDGNPLPAEVVKFTGKKRGKAFKGTTDKSGKLILYLPKGDRYALDFIYTKNYLVSDVTYSKGTSTSELTVGYMGTKEILKEKKEEAERVAAEEKRLKEEKIAFEKECAARKLSIEEGYKRAAEEFVSGTRRNEEGKVVSKVIDRNKWSEKLIVCDLTGSMMPYASELALWYKLNYKKESNLQFVFFNDGDEMDDEKKKIGETGGIYYGKSESLEKLTQLMAKVSAAGSGGDCPENNMEALIKGTKMATPYKELVMIVDNNAPVKDISLLSKFDKPVHIILCGCYNGHVLEDYLNIALKTKGTIHTIEEDIVKIAGMSEGQEVKIGTQTYRIMGGQFVRVSKA